MIEVDFCSGDMNVEPGYSGTHPLDEVSATRSNQLSMWVWDQGDARWVERSHFAGKEVTFVLILSTSVENLCSECM